MMVENWAESAITAIPQTTDSHSRRTGLRNTKAAITQQAALTAMAIMVTRARCATRVDVAWSCSLSLAIPAHMHPTAPMAIASAADISYLLRGQPAEANTTAIHPQNP